MHGYHHHSHPIAAPPAQAPLVPAPVQLAAPAAPVDVRTADLHLQGRRRDGALEFTAALAVVCIVCIAAVAWVRGTPVDPPAAAPAPAPAAATSTSSTSSAG